MGNRDVHIRSAHKITGASGFSLRNSASPIAWAGERSPRAYIDGHVVVIVDIEGGSVAIRRVGQKGGAILVQSNVESGDHDAWLSRTFRPHGEVAGWSDPIIAELAARFPGLQSYTDGSLFAGLVTSIIGQSISIASAMSVQRRLALAFNEGVDVDGRLMAPLPSAHDLADASLELIRESGVTWKRAEGLQAIAREEVAGTLPNGYVEDPVFVERELVRLPMVGPWTAASALLWGVGSPDAYPKGDVALLRAARLAYAWDGMTMRDLDALSEGWRPYRAIATRLLWTNLLGTGWQ